MGSCVSTVLPCRVRSPKGRTPLSDDSDNRELPGEVNGKELPDSVNSNYLPDDVHSKLVPNGIHRKHLPDDVHDKMKLVKTRRRALLVGITYSTSNTWSQLDGPHGDVDQYRDLLISA
jgi:hypothetical protein